MTDGPVVVTGAAGFVGSRLCRRLLDAGLSVRGIDNFDPFYARDIKERAVASLRARRGFSLLEADVRDPAAMGRLLPGAATVVHLAARAGVRASVADPDAYGEINVRGTDAVLRAMARHGVRRMVFASSSSVYSGPIPFREGEVAGTPRSPYGASKRAAEALCAAAAARWGMRIASLRFFSLYGPGQRPDQALHRFARQLAEGTVIDRYGPDGSARDYTFVDDAIAAVRSALRWTDGPAGVEILNVGSGRAVGLHEVLDALSAQMGRRARLRLRPPHPADAERTLADLTRIRATLGWYPRVTFDEGLVAFLQWFEVAYGPQSRAAS